MDLVTTTRREQCVCSSQHRPSEAVQEAVQKRSSLIAVIPRDFIGIFVPDYLYFCNTHFYVSLNFFMILLFRYFSQQFRNQEFLIHRYVCLRDLKFRGFCHSRKSEAPARKRGFCRDSNCTFYRYTLKIFQNFLVR